MVFSKWFLVPLLKLLGAAPPRIQDLFHDLRLRDFLAMFAPIPPVPLPLAQPVLKPDPETERRQRVQEFIEHPEFLSLFREAVRRFQALPPKTLLSRTRKPQKDQ